LDQSFSLGDWCSLDPPGSLNYYTPHCKVKLACLQALLLQLYRYNWNNNDALGSTPF
jgi:hypothetical protein